MDKLKEKISKYLDSNDTKIGRIVDLSLILINMLACVLIVIETYSKEAEWPLWVKIAEITVVLIFSIEYILRVFIAESRIKYIFSFYGIIDFISIVPSIVTIDGFNFLRALKVLRILRFVRFLEDNTFFFGKISRFKLQAVKTIFTVFTILFVSSGFIYFAEAPASKKQIIESTDSWNNSEKAINRARVSRGELIPMNDESIIDTSGRIQTFGDAFYYVVTTLSTVGFGDFVPFTSLGRFFTVVMILSGAILIPWQAGKLIRMLILDEACKRDITCSKCGLTGHDIDASHCKACGSVIFQKYSGD